MERHFDDEGFEFDRLLLLGGCYRRLADVGEILVTLDAIGDGDHEAWVREFAALGGRLRAQAEASESAGHMVSASSAYLRACTYYATASAHAPGTSDPERYHSLWESHRGCWDRAVATFDPPVEKVPVPYEDTELEGYFFHARPAPGADPGAPRPLLILNNGSDGPVSDMWSSGAGAAIERGWHAFTFDGPGQGAALHRQSLYFRADWEAVIAPVVDYLVARSDVDASRIALAGVSQAGYWVPRALAFEHRIVAGVADPGVVRVGASWREHLPAPLAQLLDSGDREHFDEYMRAGLGSEPQALAELRWRMAPYGTDSFFDAYTAADAMALDADTLARIRCPVLIASPDHEQFWPGQSVEMDAAIADSTLVEFTEAEGAAWHCEPAGRALREERICDWLAPLLDGP